MVTPKLTPVRGAVNPTDESPDSHSNPFWDTEEPGRLDTQDTAFPAVTDNDDPHGADSWAPYRRREGAQRLKQLLTLDNNPVAEFFVTEDGVWFTPIYEGAFKTTGLRETLDEVKSVIADQLSVAPTAFGTRQGASAWRARRPDPNRVEYTRDAPNGDFEAVSVTPLTVTHTVWDEGVAVRTEPEVYEVVDFDEGLAYARQRYGVPDAPPAPSARPAPPKKPRALSKREGDAMLRRILEERGGDGPWPAVGFLAPDGSKVMMEHDGQVRGEDHRAIGAYLPPRFSDADLSPTDRMDLVMRATGLVRLVYVRNPQIRYAAVDAETPLTSAQREAIKELAVDERLTGLEINAVQVDPLTLRRAHVELWKKADRLQELEEAALAAYERGDFELAEDLDAEHAELAERLDNADDEDSTHYDLDPVQTALNEMAALHHAYLTGALYNGRRHLTEQEYFEHLQGIAHDQFNRDDIPDEQLAEAARDAYERVLYLRNRRATPSGFELGDLTINDKHPPHELDDATRWSDSYHSENQYEDPNLKLGSKSVFELRDDLLQRGTLPRSGDQVHAIASFLEGDEEGFGIALDNILENNSHPSNRVLGMFFDHPEILEHTVQWLQDLRDEWLEDAVNTAATSDDEEYRADNIAAWPEDSDVRVMYENALKADRFAKFLRGSDRQAQRFEVSPNDITLSYEEDENEFAFYAFYEDILAGTIQGIIDEENGLARVTMARVEDIFQNQGIGTRLYRAVLKWAGSKNLWVRPDVAVSDAARAVYHKLRKMPDVSHRPAPSDREILINEDQGGEYGVWSPGESRPLYYEYRRGRLWAAKVAQVRPLPLPGPPAPSVRPRPAEPKDRGMELVEVSEFLDGELVNQKRMTRQKAREYAKENRMIPVHDSDRGGYVYSRNLERSLTITNEEGRRIRANKPVVCVDLDGTLLGDPDDDNEEASGQPGLADPVKGAALAMQTFVDLGWEVLIHTARMSKARSPEQRQHFAEEIGRHLRDHNIPFTGIVSGPKPVADHYIDDKAVPFDGDWWSVTKKLTVQGSNSREALGFGISPNTNDWTDVDEISEDLEVDPDGGRDQLLTEGNH